MERKTSPLSARHLSVLLLAALAIAAASFSVSRFSHAAGEPTLSISLDDTSLTSGETTVVTFAFSATPFNFDNADVDLSDANGALGTVAPTADDRVWRAVFTPAPGVNDPTNTIVVGTQWNDSGGVSPVGPTASPNYTVQTTSGSGGGGGGPCSSSNVTLGRPNGGEILVAGRETDVFWNMNSCLATSAQLLLSSDGGATYFVTATSQQPSSGYYRWTVPEAPSASSRMRIRLLASGGTELASDDSDGTFVIQPSSTPPADPTAPATSTSPAPTPPPPAPAPAPADSGTTTPPASGGTTPPAAPAPPLTAPATTPPVTAPPPKPAPRVAPAAPPAQTPPDSTASSTPIDPPMPDVNQNPTTAPAPTALTLDSVQSAAETASSFAPPWLEMGFSFAVGALAMLGLVLGFQKTVQRRKAAAASMKRPCVRCHGSGSEPDEKKLQACDECDGTGQVEDENEPGTECPHCKGEGEDPCHVCKGSGKRADGQECPACKGGGKTLTGKQDEDGEDEVAECEICHGEGEVSATVKKMIPCEKCNGTGKI